MLLLLLPLERTQCLLLPNQHPGNHDNQYLIKAAMRSMMSGNFATQSGSFAQQWHRNVASIRMDREYELLDNNFHEFVTAAILFIKTKEPALLNNEFRSSLERFRRDSHNSAPPIVSAQEAVDRMLSTLESTSSTLTIAACRIATAAVEAPPAYDEAVQCHRRKT
jgi:hypothetical protein